MAQEFLPDDLKPVDPEAAKAAAAEAEAREAEQQKVEQEAKNMGWSPKENWRGDPDKWIPADKFVERGKNLLPILQERLDRQTQEITELRGTIKQFGDHHKKALQDQKDAAIAQLKKARQEAFENRDAAAFEEADEKLAAARTQGVTDGGASTNGQDPNAQTVFSPEQYEAWKSENTWYQQDQTLEKYADAVAPFVRDTNPHLRGKEFLDAVTKEVMTRHPEKFNNPNRDAPNAVSDGGSEYKGPSREQKSFVDLPADAKVQCDRFVKEGLYQTREQYVQEYFNQGTYYEFGEDATG